MLEEGANVDMTDSNGNTPLYITCSLKPSPVDIDVNLDNLEFVKHLIGAGANVNSVNGGLKWTPLMKVWCTVV